MFQHAWSRFASEEQRLKWTIPAYNVQWLAAYRQIPHCTKNKGGSLLIQLFSSLLLGTSMPGADTVTYRHWNFIFYQPYVPCHICPGCNNSSFRRPLVSSNLDRKTMQMMYKVITREQKKQDCTVLPASSQKLSHKKQSNSLMRQTSLPPDVGSRGIRKEATYLNNKLVLQGKNQHENFLMWVPANCDYYSSSSPWMNESKILSLRHNQKAEYIEDPQTYELNHSTGEWDRTKQKLNKINLRT